MILDEYVEIIGNSKNIKYYKEKGYNIEVGKKTIVKTTDLSDGSTFKVNIKCNKCQVIKKIGWGTYLKYVKHDLTNLYSCVKCSVEKRIKTNNIKYGGNSPTCSKDIVDKIKKTNIEKYGNPSSLHGINQKKTEAIFLEKYGFNTPFKNNDIKNKIKNTLLKNYGVYSPLKSNQILKKVRDTTMEKWGVSNVFENEQVKEKIKNTFIERYGTHYSKTYEIKEKTLKTSIEKYNSKSYASSEFFKEKLCLLKKEKYNLNVISYNNFKYTILCSNCNNIYEISSDNIYRRHNNYTDEKYICTICNPIGASYSSSYESIICDFLNEYNIEYIRNDQKIINPYHIDIYIPKHNLGIEFNGLYWHSELKKEKDYHLKKYKLSKSNNVKLLQIWEDDWLNNTEIIKSIILNKLKLTPNKIWARKCIVKQISHKDTEQFLNKNHIQGYIKSFIYIGAYYNEELVSVMTFTKRKEEIELIRFCSKLNTNVVGIASKLFNYFKNNFEYKEIISFSDNTISNGNLYELLGFKYDSTSLNYYWYNGIEKYNHKKSSSKKKYYKIWGAGNKKWVYLE
jgi:very-short-patch-repair endonuclease